MRSLKSSVRMLLVCFTVLAAGSLCYAQGESLIPKLPVVSGYITDRVESVNTYWIEGQDGLILIDTQRALSRAKEVLAEVKKVGKPVVAILITHPHPDHIAGTALINEAFPSAEVYASQRTIEEIKNDTHHWIAFTKKAYGAEYPDQVFIPDHILKDRDTLRLAGVTIEVADLGPSESANATAFYLPEKRALLVGDLVIHNMIPFLLEKHSSAWLEQIAQLRKRFPGAKLVYPGHGYPGGMDALLSEQTEYIKTFRSLVEKEIASGGLQDGKLTDEAAKRIASAIEAKYPHYVEAAAVPNINAENAKAVALELTEEKRLKK